MLVSNHLSHLDILFFASAFECIFVAKSEVRDWPVFGRLAQFGGTIFIERDKASAAIRATHEVEAALASGVTVMVFPEGTSSDGSAVLPFRPMLFEPAIRAAAAVMPAWIAYSAQGAKEQDLCYYGDIEFAPHLLACLGMRDVTGRVALCGEPRVYEERKKAAATTHGAVVLARESLRL